MPGGDGFIMSRRGVNFCSTATHSNLHTWGSLQQQPFPEHEEEVHVIISKSNSGFVDQCFNQTPMIWLNRVEKLDLVPKNDSLYSFLSKSLCRIFQPVATTCKGLKLSQGTGPSINTLQGTLQVQEWIHFGDNPSKSISTDWTCGSNRTDPGYLGVAAPLCEMARGC